MNIVVIDVEKTSLPRCVWTKPCLFASASGTHMCSATAMPCLKCAQHLNHSALVARAMAGEPACVGCAGTIRTVHALRHFTTWRHPRVYAREIPAVCPEPLYQVLLPLKSAFCRLLSCRFCRNSRRCVSIRKLSKGSCRSSEGSCNATPARQCSRWRMSDSSL